MKTIKFSLIAFLFISFVACSTDDDSPNVDTSMITGVWNIEEFNYTGETSGNFEGMDINASFEGVAENIDATLSFNEDNTFIMAGSYDVRLSSEGITEVVPVNNASSSGTWKIEGDYIITSGAVGQVQGQGVAGPQEGRMRISEVTETRMVLIIDQESTTSQGGMDFTMKMDGIYVLTK
ncbi:lipocalin family protein [Christiangramia sp. SM2212]|uniref:Lipocalin family protein n=1 Tax=Christiangramia sediminicola TaxID=3073267 RepID=A0ABU1EUH9_9FLAO|nr:lipocalin family protein [Christiangramia sp. SM2212]MDR5592041.1 lipocalin family protein [Christiangramia sp. SM2212]